MSSVGLVLGGGGITGAAYHFGTLLAIQMATGWDPDDAEVIIGTSSGSFAGAMVRGHALSLDTLVGPSGSVDEAAEWLRSRLYQRATPGGMLRWVRRGLLPGITRPNLNLVLGSPALYKTAGIEEWVTGTLGRLGETWPDKPTVIIGFDLDTRERVAFGTEAAPEVPLCQAVAASSAVPFVYEPVRIDGRWYVDGGVASGTNADLLLAHPEPLDLIIVVAPMAASESRPGSRFYEDLFDRAGRTALAGELDLIRSTWPDADLLVLRPDDRVLEESRPNPMSVEAAIPSFLVTLRSMRDELAHSSTWDLLEKHLVTERARS